MFKIGVKNLTQEALEALSLPQKCRKVAVVEEEEEPDELGWDSLAVQYQVLSLQTSGQTS
jgi:hypothetical protein